MARLGLCAGLGVFCILAAVVLSIFVQISQVTGSSSVLRHIQLSTVDTTNLGPALAASGVDVSSLYATGPRTGDNQGLRQYYKAGLWNQCESNSASGTSDVSCTGTAWGRRFEPIRTLLADVPSALATNVGNALGNNYFTATTSGTYTHSAFYLLFIGALLAGVSLVTSVLAHRFAFLISALAGILAFLFFAVGSALWTAVLYKLRNAINGATLGSSSLGITVSYGNALWISWASAAAALLSVIPFFLACCFGGSRRTYDDYDEKY